MPEPIPAPLQTSPATLPNAGVWRRLAALVYDSFLLFGLLVVPLFIVIGIANGLAPSNLSDDTVVHELPSIGPSPLLLFYEILVVVSFYCYFWRRTGQTLGMQAWRLRVDNIDGGRPSLRQCLLRALVGLPALLLAGLGFWWIWVDRDGRAWHDRASQTKVVVLPKRKR